MKRRIKRVESRRVGNPLPRFDTPPVIETVLGLQFNLLPHFSAAHAGWFWRNYLDKDWTSVKTVPRLPDQFERFGGERIWQRPQLEVHTAPQPERIQIIRKDDERMIQVQNTRFIYNWLKRTSEYPSYEKLLPQFQENFDLFKNFVREAELGKLELTQWEVTYVNHIPRGELWESVADWRDILLDFYVPGISEKGLLLDGFGGEWNLIIGKNEGRLHISVQHGKGKKDEEEYEIMVMKVTARGPIKEGTFVEGLELGHESIVRTFTAVTTPKAHKHWKRKA